MVTFSDDYRELLEDAHNALRALLDASAPESWMGLRAGYGELRRALRRDVADREREERLEEQRNREDGWKRTPAARQESLVLDLLGDDRLTFREMTARLNVELVGAYEKPVAYESHVRRLVMRMHRAGQLEGESDDSFRGKLRYRYFRKRPLEGPIADLERAYLDNGDEDGGA